MKLIENCSQTAQKTRRVNGTLTSEIIPVTIVYMAPKSSSRSRTKTTKFLLGNLMYIYLHIIVNSHHSSCICLNINRQSDDQSRDRYVNMNGTWRPNSYSWLLYIWTWGLWVSIQSAGDLVSQTSKVQILHSAGEDNLFPFDSKSLHCAKALSKSNNKHVWISNRILLKIVPWDPVENTWIWCRLWLGAVTERTITSTNVDRKPGLQTVSLGQNGFNQIHEIPS